MKASAVASPERLYASRSRSHGWQFAQYQLNPIRNRPASSLWMRTLALLLIVSVAGCGTTPAIQQSGSYEQALTEKPTSYRLPAGANIALAAGRFDPTITFVDYKPTTTPDMGQFVNKCVADPGLIIFTLGLGVLLCPIIGPVTAGTFKALVESHAVLVDSHHKVVMQKLAEAMKSAPFEHSLFEQVRRSAFEHGIADLENLPNQPSHAILDQQQYEEKANYIFELSVTNLTLNPNFSDKNSLLLITAKGQLMHSDNHVIVDNFSSQIEIPIPVGDSGDHVVKSAFDSSLTKISRRFVNEWIVPIIGGIRTPDSHGTNPSSGAVPNDDYLNCVKMGVEKCDDYVSCFFGGKRQWTHRSKCDSENSTGSATVTISNENKTPSGVKSAISGTAQPSPQTSFSAAPTTTQTPMEQSRTEPVAPTPPKCTESVFPRETNPETAELRDIIENRCRN